MLQKITMTDPAGTLGAHAGRRRIAAGHFPKALERNLLKVSTIIRYLCWTPLLVKSTVAHPISMKPAFQGVGSVSGGAVQCNDEVKFDSAFRNLHSAIR